MKKYSHTLVRDGMPFIEPILRNVEPFMDKMLVTVSEKSTDGTKELLNKLKKEWKGKLVINTENVKHVRHLTQERQKQLDATPMGAWILFLDADDWWTKEQLQLMEMFIASDVDGLAVNPIQMIDDKTHDSSWKNRWFTKWFRKQKGVHYKHPWPRDLIYKDNQMLYWRKNTRVPRIAVRYFHLSNLMKWRFRDEKWAKEYESHIGNPVIYDGGWKEDVDKIYAYMRS